jgi:hypothetical protein
LIKQCSIFKNASYIAEATLYIGLVTGGKCTVDCRETSVTVVSVSISLLCGLNSAIHVETRVR